MTRTLYGTPDSKDSLWVPSEFRVTRSRSKTYSKMPIQARLKRNRHGKIGSARQRSLVKIRSLIRKRIQSTADTTNSDTATDDPHAKLVDASSRTVTKSIVAPTSRNAPDRSSLDKDWRHSRCRTGDSPHDIWVRLGGLVDMDITKSMIVTRPAGTLSKNTHRQVDLSLTPPPMSGPTRLPSADADAIFAAIAGY